MVHFSAPEALKTLQQPSFGATGTKTARNLKHSKVVNRLIKMAISSGRNIDLCIKLSQIPEKHQLEPYLG